MDGGVLINGGVVVKPQTYLFVSGLFFGLVCLGHLLRIVFDWKLTIGTYDVSMAISWAAVFVTAGLVSWAIAMLFREEHRKL